MAFAAAFARPASSSFTRPGAASLWSPPRPFPVQRWLAQRPAAGSAAVSGGSSPRQDAAPARKPAGTEAGAPSPQRQQRVPGEPPRLDLELRWLFCRSPLPPDDDFFISLRIEVGRRAWSLAHAIGAPRLPWSPAPGADTDLNKLRARLATDVHLGLAMVETAPIRYPRPVRNALLAKHAGLIGRCLVDLLRHREAGSLSDELTRLFDALRQCM